MKENETQVERYLTRRITRRDVIKAGGLAALGLAFSKPIISTIHPRPAFAHYHGGAHGSNLCEITVKLLVVTYNGNDVGSEWKYDITIQGQSTHFPQRTLNPGGVDVIPAADQLVYFGSGAPCPGQTTINFSVSATEVDPVFNDIGTTNLPITIDCSTSASGRIYVFVQENPIPGFPALLSFLFEITTACP